jgi:type IV pilus assembly protein PilO
MALYERQVAKLEELIPAAEEVPVLLDDMSVRARQDGVDITRLLPEPAEESPYYNKTSYEVAVSGDYHAVGRFLTGVASLSRIVNPVELELAPHPQPQLFPEIEAPILATFRIETYVLPDQNASPPAAEGGSEG